MPAKQYAFEPKPEDPRRSAQLQWDQIREELNDTREALEHSEAERVSQAALIDMLRNELASVKAAYAVVERSNTVMRTKLQIAGGIVLDALKADELERGSAVSEYAVKSPVMVEHDDEPEQRPIFLRPVVPPPNEM